MLSYYHDRDDEGLAVRGAVSVRTARLKTTPGDKIRFEVHSRAPSSQGRNSNSTFAGQKWYIKATHPGEAARWIQMIARSIEFYQQKDRAQLLPPSSDGESVLSNREGPKRTKSLRSSVDILRSWSDRSSHDGNRSRAASVDQPVGPSESVTDQVAPEAEAIYEPDGRQEDKKNVSSGYLTYVL